MASHALHNHVQPYVVMYNFGSCADSAFWDCVVQQGGPLLALQPPVLFISGSSDDLCNLVHLRQVCSQMQSSDIRFVVTKVSKNLVDPLSAVLRPSHCLYPVMG